MAAAQTNGALAWVTAVGGLAGFTALVITIVRASKRKYVPDPALRGLLRAMIDDFDEIVNAGGRPALWFSEAPRRERCGEMASLNGAVVDDELNLRIAEARAQYEDCFSCSSPSQSANQLESQLSAARAGRAAASRAIERLNLLTRKYGHL